MLVILCCLSTGLVIDAVVVVVGVGVVVVTSEEGRVFVLWLHILVEFVVALWLVCSLETGATTATTSVSVF